MSPVLIKFSDVKARAIFIAYDAAANKLYYRPKAGNRCNTMGFNGYVIEAPSKGHSREFLDDDLVIMMPRN